MGYEYRLALSPPASDLHALCRAVVEASWRELPTSFADGAGLGVGDATGSDDEVWPHVADLRIESSSSIFVLCHNQRGSDLLQALVVALERAGHTVLVDDEV